MKRLLTAILPALLLACSARALWALWAAQEPSGVAGECPVIVTGEIVKIDEAAATGRDISLRDLSGDRTLDVAHIRISEVHLNVLISVETAVGGEILARMHSLKDKIRISLDVRYDVGTKALWMLYLGDDGSFYINYRPEQKQPAGSYGKVRPHMAYPIAAARGGGVTTQVYTVEEWIASQREKRHPMTDAEKKDRERVAALRKATAEAMKGLYADGRLDEKRLPTLLELPVDVRSWLINRGPEELGTSMDDWVTVRLYLARNDPVENHRVRATSGFGKTHGYPRCKPFLLEMIRDQSPSMRLFACQALMFTEDKSIADDIAKLLADPDRRVAMTAVRGLGYVGDARHLRAVMDWYRSVSGGPTPPTPEEAAVIGETLARLGEEEVSLSLFSQGMASDNWNVRRRAVQILEACRSNKVVPAAMSELVPEMGRTLKNRREHHVDDIVLTALVDVLADRTGQKHGKDLLAWLGWWKTACRDYGAAEATFDAGEVRELQAEHERLFAKPPAAR